MRCRLPAKLNPCAAAGFSSPHARPLSSNRLSESTTVRGGTATAGDTSRSLVNAYSAFQRTQQLSEVDRVKRAFAKVS